MFNYDEKKFFDCAAREHHPAPRKPLSMFEQVEFTSRELRETLERFMNLERTMKEKYDDLCKIMTQDNVTFKNMMQEAWTDFTSAVRSEINLFETNTETIVALFKQAVNERIDAYNKSTSESFNDYTNHLQTFIDSFEKELNDEFAAYKNDINTIIANHGQRFEQQDAKISDAIAYMKTNLNASIAEMITQMQSTVIVTPEMYGAIGDGINDDTTAIQTALQSGKIVKFRPVMYRVKNDATNRLVVPDNCELHGNGATLKAINANVETGSILMLEGNNIIVKDFTIIGDASANTKTVEGYNHGILIGGERVTVENCHVLECFTDGIYIRANNVNVRNCVIDGCGRNGFSITNGKNVRVENVESSNSYRVAPKAGFDIEPSFDTDVVDNIELINIRSAGNGGAGLCIGLAHMKDSVHCNIVINGFVDNASYGAIEIGAHTPNIAMYGGIVLNDVMSMNSPQHAICIRPRDTEKAPHVIFNNLIVDNANTSGESTGYGSGIYFYNESGNVQFNGVKFLHGERMTREFYAGTVKNVYVFNSPEIKEDVCGAVMVIGDYPNAAQIVDTSGVYNIVSARVLVNLPYMGEVVFRAPTHEHVKKIMVVVENDTETHLDFKMPLYPLAESGKVKCSTKGGNLVIANIRNEYYAVLSANGNWVER